MTPRSGRWHFCSGDPLAHSIMPSNKPCSGTRMRPRLFGSTTSLLSVHFPVLPLKPRYTAPATPLPLPGIAAATFRRFWVALRM